ncbi:hypothetical protein LXL04_012091 [Taraxacum kok-saghyz]
MDTCFVFLFIIVIIASFSSNTTAEIYEPLDSVMLHYNVSITNMGLSRLKVHCTSSFSKYDDLGSHILNSEDEYEFSFDVHEDERVTYSCDFQRHRKYKHIHVYNRNLQHQCGNGSVNTCDWMMVILTGQNPVFDNSFYIYDTSQNPQKYVRFCQQSFLRLTQKRELCILIVIANNSHININAAQSEWDMLQEGETLIRITTSTSDFDNILGGDKYNKSNIKNKYEQKYFLQVLKQKYYQHP